MQNSLLSRITMEKTYQKPASPWLLKTKYIILFLVISITLGCISLLSTQTNIPLGWFKLLQMICFCAAGILYVKQIRRYNFALKNGGNGKLQFSILLFALIFLALFILYYITYPEFILMALGSASAFILPFIIAQSWRTINAFSGIQ